MDEQRVEGRAKRDLVSGSLTANILQMAGPLAAGMALQAFYSIADTFWLGRWDTDAVGAAGVSIPFFFFVISFGMGFGNAGTALVAQYTGAKRYREADHAAGQTLGLLCVLAICLVAPLAIFAPQVMRAYSVPLDMAPQAEIYFRIMLIGLPIRAFGMAYGSVLRALGDTFTVVLIGLVANVVNLVLDPVLIFGFLGVPALGTGGAAIASVLSQALAALTCYILLRRGRGGLEVRLSDLKPKWSILKRMFLVGMPTAVGNSSNSLGFMTFQFMVNRLGPTVVSAFTIGFRIVHFFSVPSQALALAAAPIVGQALGAGRPGRARRAVNISAMVVALGMLLPVAFVMWKGQLVASLFVLDEAVRQEGAMLFLIVPASSYCFQVISVFLAAFYGSGHTLPAMVLHVARLWILRLPVGWLLAFPLGLGSLGIYIGMVVGNILSAVLALWLFRRGNWQKAIVPVRGKPPGDNPDKTTPPEAL